VANDAIGSDSTVNHLCIVRDVLTTQDIDSLAAQSAIGEPEAGAEYTVAGFAGSLLSRGC
jgi:hypothetical protein